MLRTAPTEVPVQSLPDLLFQWRLGTFDQGDGRHDDSAQTETALTGLFLQERGLHWMRMLARADTLGCAYGAAFKRTDWEVAGGGRNAVDQHHAGATVTLSTTEAHAHQTEVVAQDMNRHAARLRIATSHDAIDCYIHRPPSPKINVTMSLRLRSW
jgi:hypothetical protein